MNLGLFEHSKNTTYYNWLWKTPPIRSENLKYWIIINRLQWLALISAIVALLATVVIINYRLETMIGVLSTLWAIPFLSLFLSYLGNAFLGIVRQEQLDTALIQWGNIGFINAKVGEQPITGRISVLFGLIDLIVAILLLLMGLYFLFWT